MRKLLLGGFMLMGLAGITACSAKDIALTISANGEYQDKLFSDFTGEKLEVYDIRYVVGHTTKGVNLHIESNAEKSIRVHAQESILESIEVEQVNGKIKIHGEKNAKYATPAIDIFISGYCFDTMMLGCSTSEIDPNCLSSSPSVSISGGAVMEMDLPVALKEVSLALSGGSTAHFTSVTSETLKLNLSGGSIIHLDSLTTGTIHSDLSGGSEGFINGASTSGSLVASGGSIYSLGSFTMDKATISSSGGSEVTLGVKDEMSITASGGSVVDIYGSPMVTKQNLSGGSKLNFK